MKRILISFFSILSLFLVVVNSAYSVPNVISYQGVLNDDNGAPLSTTVSMTFSIYDTATGGVPLWNETQNVQVSNGLFNVQLGSVEPLSSSLFMHDTLFLGVQVASDQEMLPRQKLTPGPYAHKAELTSPAAFPIGAILPWAKSIEGVPALSDGWVECNGQIIDDPESPLNSQAVPNLNGQNRFLRGNSTSGGVGGIESVNLNHSHEYSSTGFDRYNSTKALTSLSASTSLGNVENRPPYYDVVWIIRIK